MLHHSLLAFALSAVTAAIPTIEVKGSKFFTSDGNQFYVKGNFLIYLRRQVNRRGWRRHWLTVASDRHCVPTSP